VNVAWSQLKRERLLYSQDRGVYFLIPIIKHGRGVDFETKGREVRENRVRESDGRNSIELKTIQVDQPWKGEDDVV
jgi:hypothetical protein